MLIFLPLNAWNVNSLFVELCSSNSGQYLMQVRHRFLRIISSASGTFTSNILKFWITLPYLTSHKSLLHHNQVCFNKIIETRRSFVVLAEVFIYLLNAFWWKISFGLLCELKELPFSTNLSWRIFSGIQSVMSKVFWDNKYKVEFGLGHCVLFSGKTQGPDTVLL